MNDVDIGWGSKGNQPISRFLQNLQEMGGFILVDLAAQCLQSYSGEH
jgi:hypothetical protein